MSTIIQIRPTRRMPAMRKSREEAAETRKRIVRAAGLTHGGFYKHFASKDELVAEATAEAVDAAIDEWLTGSPTIAATVGAYLSTGHRDDPASGCPLAAVGSELSRSSKKVREAAAEGFVRLVEFLARKADTVDARRRA